MAQIPARAIDNSAAPQRFFAAMAGSAFRGLVRPEFALRAIRYDRTWYREELYDRFLIARPAGFGEFVDKRRAEFLAGRICAKQALADLGIDATVPVGRHRAPIWPAGVKGTITHGEDIAVAVVADAETVLGIGVDVEKCIDQRLVEEIAPQVASDGERALLRSLGGVSESQALSILFSVKECFFKAAYGLVGRYFDFNAVEAVSINLEEGRVTLIVHPGLHPIFDEGREVSASFKLNDGSLISFLAI